VEQAQKIQTEANVVGRPKKKRVRRRRPRLEVLKVGGSPGDAIKKACDYSTPRHVMTVAEIAEYLKVQRSTICIWARKGKIPAFKIGTDWRFDRDAIDKWTTGRTSEVLKKRSAAARVAPKKTGMH
jgi:excisionase family DNA binding protein